MLHKERRINNSREYGYIYKHGRRSVGKNLILFTISTDSWGTRVGIVTSKKIGNAVTRNRAKRQLREVIRKHWETLPKGMNLVVVARYNIKEATFEQMEREILRLMGKVTNK